jgi:hypothetical protein
MLRAVNEAMATSVVVGEVAGRRVEGLAGRRRGDGSNVTRTSKEGEVEGSERDTGSTGPSRTP